MKEVQYNHITHIQSDFSAWYPNYKSKTNTMFNLNVTVRGKIPRWYPTLPPPGVYSLNNPLFSWVWEPQWTCWNSLPSLRNGSCYMIKAKGFFRERSQISCFEAIKRETILGGPNLIKAFKKTLSSLKEEIQSMRKMFMLPMKKPTSMLGRCV